MRTMILLSLFAALAACATTVRGPEGERLTLLEPADQALAQGETNRVAIAVTRANFDAAVPVRVQGLPSGVSIIEDDRVLASGENMLNLTLYASRDAQPVTDHPVRVTVTGPDGIEATEVFELTVRASS